MFAPFRDALAAHDSEFSWDVWNCQTSAASPAELGDLSNLVSCKAQVFPGLSDADSLYVAAAENDEQALAAAIERLAAAVDERKRIVANYQMQKRWMTSILCVVISSLHICRLSHQHSRLFSCPDAICGELRSRVLPHEP